MRKRKAPASILQRSQRFSSITRCVTLTHWALNSRKGRTNGVSNHSALCSELAWHRLCPTRFGQHRDISAFSIIMDRHSDMESTYLPDYENN